MTHHPDHARDRFGLVPIDKPQPPDPYPERPTSLGGVRQHTPPLPTPARKVTVDHDRSGPLPFAAVLQPATPPRRPDRPRRRRWLPWASVGLSAFGQLQLALAIAFGAVSPMLGIVVCLLWLVCSLVLITAEVVGDAPGHRFARPDAFDDPHALEIPCDLAWPERSDDGSDPEWLDR